MVAGGCRVFRNCRGNCAAVHAGVLLPGRFRGATSLPRQHRQRARRGRPHRVHGLCPVPIAHQRLPMTPSSARSLSCTHSTPEVTHVMCFTHVEAHHSPNKLLWGSRRIQDGKSACLVHENHLNVNDDWGGLKVLRKDKNGCRNRGWEEGERNFGIVGRVGSDPPLLAGPCRLLSTRDRRKRRPLPRWKRVSIWLPQPGYNCQ